MKKSHHHTASSNLWLGMAAGAVVSAAGMYYASHNQREVKKMTKKITHTAENAMHGIDKAVQGITRNF